MSEASHMGQDHLKILTSEEYLRLQEILQNQFDFDATKLTTTKVNPMSSPYSIGLHAKDSPTPSPQVRFSA